MTMLAAPCLTGLDAVQAAKAEPGHRAIRLDGMNLVIDRESAHELEAEGTSFCYLCWCAAAGRVVTVPVN